MTYHVPVLLSESVSGLDIRPEGVYVDVTFGGGGHSRAILEQLTSGMLLAFDQDADAEQNVLTDNRFRFIRGNFRYLSQFLKYLGYDKVDGILADLGVSSHHFDASQRGFTFREEARLDMRMNASSKRTAATILNEYHQGDLNRIFWQYGEINNARRLTQLIIKARMQQPLETNSDLMKAIAPVTPRETTNKYLAKVFQTLRIEVNQEMESLRSLLEQSPSLIKTGGRLVIISYHSLEDRLVKNFIRNGKLEGEAEKDLYGHIHVPFRQKHSKVIIPEPAETIQNSRARSAKLRIAERL